MHRRIVIILGLAWAMAGPLEAATFTRAPLAPELQLDALTRRVTRERIGRDLFANPYATVTIANVDLYDRFPYVESRRFQVVSDPQWNRLVAGEVGHDLVAFDGRGTTTGPLAEPRGLAVDEANRVYVADTGHDRIVVLQANTQFDDIQFQPLYTIAGLHGPYDVAWSDGGTPFAAGDDRLYVADTGGNRVVAVALEASPRIVATIGTLGSGAGCFAGPMAVTVGRSGNANTHDVYVADAHNHRIVHLLEKAGGFAWVGERRHDADVLTSLEADRWSNLYAAAPHQDRVLKFDATLTPVAELATGGTHPRDFHVPMYRVDDHRNATVARVGQPSGVAVGQWSDANGLTLWSLGVEVRDLTVASGSTPTTRFTLTDQALVTIETFDRTDGRVLGRRSLGPLAAGAHEAALGADDLALAGDATDLAVRVIATSGYANGGGDVAEAGFRGPGGGSPARAMLLGSSPNPVTVTTRLRFALPAADAGRARLAVFDASGRRVRAFGSGFAAGLNEVVWDGTGDRGQRLENGVYFYRLDVGAQRFSRRLVLAR